MPEQRETEHGKQNRQSAMSWLFGGLLCLSMAVAAYWSGNIGYGWYQAWARSSERPTDLPLLVADDELELGNVNECEAHKHTIRIRNTSNSLLLIHSISSSCDCLGITPDKNLRLEPNSAASLTLTLKTVADKRQARQGGRNLLAVPLRAQYTKEGEESPSLAEWVLQGAIQPAVILDTESIDIGARSILGPALAYEINVQTMPFVAEVECRAPSPWICRVEKRPVANAETRYKVRVTFSQLLEPQRVDGILQINPIDHEGNRLPAKEVQLAGELLPDVIATPQSINLGRGVVGSKHTEWLRVDSLTKRDFQITKASADEDLNVAEVKELGATGGVYKLVVAMNQAGEQQRSVRFTVAGIGQIPHEIVVTVRYIGIPRPR